jgi:purine-nucleoside phosphorylase
MNRAILDEADRRMRQILPEARPALGIILGSGWRDAAQSFTIRQTVAYADIPGLGATQVAGHAGQLLWAEHSGCQLFVFEGRRHWYEGVGWEPVAIPLSLLRAFGAGAVLLTNSAGGIRPDLRPGDLMALDDHINAMGVHPLVGPHDPRWGERFPVMTDVYDPVLRGLLDASAWRRGVPLAHGAYLAVSGPSYETPAEITAFRTLGADAVGMSTVPEAILARAAGLRVAAISCITNAAAAEGQPLGHAEVLAMAAAAAPRVSALVQEFVTMLAEERR